MVTHVIQMCFQARRRSTSVFAGKQGFITLRDLFRWAERYSKNPDVDGGFHDWEQHIAGDGKESVNVFLTLNSIIIHKCYTFSYTTHHRHHGRHHQASSSSPTLPSLS